MSNISFICQIYNRLNEYGRYFENNIKKYLQKYLESI